MSQASTDPTATAHLRAGERITLDELAVQLSAVAVWLRQLAIAAETPDVPVELGEMCDRMIAWAIELAGCGEVVAEVDRIIAESVPLAPFFGAAQPWGTRAHGSDRDKSGKQLLTVLTHWQIKALVRDADMPWRDQQPGIPYLDGIAGLPGLEDWESRRAVRRRAAEREQRIRERAARELCPTCDVSDGPCRTKTDRLAETFHKPRYAAAVAYVDAEGSD